MDISFPLPLIPLLCHCSLLLASSKHPMSRLARCSQLECHFRLEFSSLLDKFTYVQVPSPPLFHSSCSGSSRMPPPEAVPDAIKTELGHELHCGPFSFWGCQMRRRRLWKWMWIGTWRDSNLCPVGKLWLLREYLIQARRYSGSTQVQGPESNDPLAFAL